MGIAEDIRKDWGPEKYAQCLAARATVPGPAVSDPWDGVPAIDTQAAYLPSQPSATAPLAWCGPPAPLPSRTLSFARVAPVEDGPYPAPEITSEDGVAGPDKRAVRDLVRDAEAAGWDVVVTYARGSWPNAATGRPGAPKDSLAVRMSKPEGLAVAVYAGPAKGAWNWLTLALLEYGQRRQRYEKITQFREAVL